MSDRWMCCPCNLASGCDGVLIFCNVRAPRGSCRPAFCRISAWERLMVWPGTIPSQIVTRTLRVTPTPPYAHGGGGRRGAWQRQGRRDVAAMGAGSRQNATCDESTARRMLRSGGRRATSEAGGGLGRGLTEVPAPRRWLRGGALPKHTGQDIRAAVE